MERLLPYYERELAFLRGYARDFARQYPKIAGRLSLGNDTSEDPHVERLIEAFALMGARISRRLEDDYPELTEALLEVLYPHYLRPFPSCSIAHFDVDGAGSRLSTPVKVPRGTELASRPVQGVTCRFRSVYDVWLGPLRVVDAEFSTVARAPRAVRPSSGVTARLTIRFAVDGEGASLPALAMQSCRLFVDGAPSMRATLRDALALRVVEAYVEDDDGRWHRSDRNPLSVVGMQDDEALVPWPARSHPAYRLLMEYFAFPEKFGFLDLDLQAAARVARGTFAVHLLLKHVEADSAAAGLMESVAAANFKLGCTPVVNLFEQRAEPIRVTHTAESYPVVADARRAWAYEIHSLDRVESAGEQMPDVRVTKYRPLYALSHREDPDAPAQYWVASRNAEVARRSPGHEFELSLVDLDFDPVTATTGILSCDVTCTNRDLPAQLAYGVPDGDLTAEGGSVARRISLLRKPTPARRLKSGRGLQWRLISQLALNRVSLVEGGAEPLREMLRLYDFTHSSGSARQIDGILGVEAEPTTAWVPDERHAGVVRGTRIKITIDEGHFIGTGVGAFAAMLDHFFALHVQVNSFTQLSVISSATGEEIVRCPPHGGQSILV
ncbi:MAG TPA: type VI secretion system baseplate subunit TssF [Nevskiaceae bacterium]